MRARVPVFLGIVFAAWATTSILQQHPELYQRHQRIAEIYGPFPRDSSKQARAERIVIVPGILEDPASVGKIPPNSIIIALNTEPPTDTFQAWLPQVLEHEILHAYKRMGAIRYDIPGAAAWGYYHAYLDREGLRDSRLNSEFEAGRRLGAKGLIDFPVLHSVIQNRVRVDSLNEGSEEPFRQYLDGAFLAGLLYGAYGENIKLVANAICILGLGGGAAHLLVLDERPELVNIVLGDSSAGSLERFLREEGMSLSQVFLPVAAFRDLLGVHASQYSRKHPSSWAFRGLIAFYLGQYARARGLFERAILGMAKDSFPVSSHLWFYGAKTFLAEESEQAAGYEFTRWLNGLPDVVRRREEEAMDAMRRQMLSDPSVIKQSDFGSFLSFRSWDSRDTLVVPAFLRWQRELEYAGGLPELESLR